jgi:seryl-tRNA synthetase
METDPGVTPQRAYFDELVAHGLLVPMGVSGLVGRGAVFEDVIGRFDDYVSQVGKVDNAERFRFPPLVSRTNFERSEYLKAFPNLIGSVHSFLGGDKEHGELLSMVERGENWGRMLDTTDVMLTPAACYPLYPMVAGVVAGDGRLFDVYSYCFRHEPSDDPARMQAFRMREFVRVGSLESVRTFRDTWLERGIAILRAVGLPGEAVIANDPFFGRRGRMLAADQRDQSLKFELIVPITSKEKPTACVSMNYHQEHFSHLFGIHMSDGSLAHTACIGFGLERIALALFKFHGFEPSRWPASVRTVLGL